MRTIRWLHFSDLHLNETGVETNRLRAKLPQYLKGLNVSCDYAFFTGDLRYAPDGDFPKNSAQYIREICAAVNVPVKNLFTVAGNHDVNCSSECRDAAVKKVFCGSDWSGYYKSGVGRIADSELNCIAKGKEQFNSVLEELYRGVDGRIALYKDASRPHFSVTTQHLNVVHLDTTINFTQGQKRDMIVGTELLMDVLENTDKTKPTVILTHFSSDFLLREEQEQVVQLFKDNGVKLWFAGHEHSDICRKQWDWFYEFQCGNLLSENGAKACVILGELDLDTLRGEISVHAWFDKGGWARYPFVRTATRDDSVYPFSLNDGVDWDIYATERQNLSDCLDMQQAEGGQFFGTRFNINLVPDLSCNGLVYVTDDRAISLHKAVDFLWEEHAEGNCSRHALLLGDGGMGKSTMLYHTCNHFVKNCNRLAIFASIQVLQASSTTIVDYVLNCLFRSNESRYKERLFAMLSKRHTAADLVLFVDGFNELNSESTFRYVAELKSLAGYPGIQIIISSRLDFLRNYGMAYFETIRTEDLRDEQVKTLFKEAEWSDIWGKRNLRILLKNPMMALLYAQTCPVIERHRDLEYCEWKAVSNVSDLLHNYYYAQVALLADRAEVSGTNIFNGICLIDYVMPYLGYRAEKSGVTVLTDDRFEEYFRSAAELCGSAIGGEALSANLRSVKRIYGLKQSNEIDGDELYGLLINLMCLMKKGNRTVSFPHQIFRDYMAAKYFFNLFTATEGVAEEWRCRIPENVLQYIRFMDEEPWKQGGGIDGKLGFYRGTERRKDDFFIENIINCWLPKDADKNIRRDLSRLDLREVSLAEHLKRSYCGTIDIDGAMVSKQTFVNDEYHDKIIGLAFSHDGKTLAAVSENGLVSVCNIETQSQMVVGRIEASGGAQIGFNEDDLLLVTSNDKTWFWYTLSYDRVTLTQNESIYRPENIPNGADGEEAADGVQKLYAMLAEEDLVEDSNAVSDDCRLLALGHSNGLIQLWSVSERVCIAEFSLGDSRICTASFSPGGRYVALSSGGKIVQLWDTEKVELKKVCHLKKPVRKVRFPETHACLECEYSDGQYTKINLTDGKTEESSSLRRITELKKAIRKRLRGVSIRKIETTDDGNAIVMANKSNTVWIWNNKQRVLNEYDKFFSNVVDVAICNADSAYAAVVADEIMPSNNTVRREVRGQRVVRTFATRKGNCMQFLPTNGRTVKKLRFFTANRIILAGFASNGDILMWELHNKVVGGEVRGHWDHINTLKNKTAEPVECAVTDSKDFLGAYENGKITVIKYGSNQVSGFYVFPGIDLSCITWNDLRCSDALKTILTNYKSKR